MTSLSLSSSNEIEEDVKGVHRRCVSLSSVDSEPIPKRRRTDTQQQQQQQQQTSSTSADVEEVEDVDSELDESEQPCSAALRDIGIGALTSMHISVLRDTCGDPIMRIPINAVSEAAVATITAVLGLHMVPVLAEEEEEENEENEEKEKKIMMMDKLCIPSTTTTTTQTTNVSLTREEVLVVVADHAAGALVLDAGTRVCLADGTVVGVIAAVMGPVSACAYAIASYYHKHSNHQNNNNNHDTNNDNNDNTNNDNTILVSALQPGTQLCYDLAIHRILHDPLAQCDTRRGTDASFINDEELPPHIRPDFSDDEAERQWKSQRRLNKYNEQQQQQREGEEQKQQKQKQRGRRYYTHAEEEISSDEEPVEVDWEKISALETCLQESRDLNNTEAAVVSGITSTTVQKEKEEEQKEEEQQREEKGEGEVPPSSNTKLVIPPWIAN